jgi:ribonuclease T2
MKQFGIALTALACLGALGAYYMVSASPDGQANTAIAAKSQSIPKGSGFDFYVLALSWSPTYCQDDQARRRDTVQCAGPRPFAFVVHGLWPQFERGYPRACQTTQNRPNPNQARAMLDIMPSERLVQHQWGMHGTCSGLSAQDYLAVVRAARERVSIPDSYASAPDWRRVTAGEVEAAFIAANPGMKEDGIGVTRRGNNLSEVRICLTRDLTPRPCPEIDQRGAGAGERLAMPPSRG